MNEQRPQPSFAIPTDLPLRVTDGSDDREEGRILRFLAPCRLKHLLDHVHPACASFELDPAAVDRMVRSFRQSGPRHPIELLDDQLIDGRTRVQAALECNMSLPAVNLSHEDLQGFTPFEYVLRANRAASCARRLTGAQIALTVARFYSDWWAEERAAAELRRKYGVAVPKEKKGEVLKLAAKQFAVSAHSLGVACRVVAGANDRLFQLAYRGRLSLAATKRILTAPGDIDANITSALTAQRNHKSQSVGKATRTPAQTADDLRHEFRCFRRIALRMDQVLKSCSDVAYDLAPLQGELDKLDGFIARLAMQVSTSPMES